LDASLQETEISRDYIISDPWMLAKDYPGLVFKQASFQDLSFLFREQFCNQLQLLNL
jgi:hypothetical protein